MNTDPHAGPALGTPDQSQSPPVCDAAAIVLPSALEDPKADSACCDEVPGPTDLEPKDSARDLAMTAVQSVSADEASVECTVAITALATEETTGPATDCLSEPYGHQMPTGPFDPLSPCPPNQLFYRSLDILKAGGLRRLIKAPLMPLLLHHCIICGQWHERPHMIKMHVRSLHPEFFNSSEGATQLAARTGGAFSPCLYCAQTRTHPRQHLHTCIALWQACALHLYCGDGHEPGRCSDGGVLRAGPGQKDGGAGLDGRDGCGEGDKIREAQCGRQGQRESEGRRSRRTSTPTLQQLWQRTRRTGPGGDRGPEAGSQNSCSSKRSVDGAQAKHRLDLVASHSGALSHSGHDHRRSEVERGNREKDSKLKDRPLPQVLFWTMMSFIKETVERMGEEEIKTAKTSGWMTAEGLWVYQRWNPETKCLEQDSTRAALKPEELSLLLADIIRLTHRETLSRFKPLRTLEENLQGQSVPVLMDVGLRCPEATTLFENLTRLQGNSSLQTSGVSFRREGFRKPPNLVKLLERVFG